MATKGRAGLGGASDFVGSEDSATASGAMMSVLAGDAA